MTLKPGVAYCFRAFYPMISDMVEGSWSHFVRRLNTELLGTTTDLRTFLFGSDRAALARYRPILEDVQEGPTPWRRYPTDLGHNFVLAHGGCNARKGDRLAAEEHLARWRGRNEEHRGVLGERFDRAGVLHDWAASVQVARWAYGQVERAGGQVWVEGEVLRGLSGGWEEVLT